MSVIDQPLTRPHWFETRELTSDNRMQLADDARARVADLFEAQAVHLSRYIMARCGSRTLADDIVQSTFEHALRLVLAEPTPKMSEAWIFLVAHRRLVDHWRSEGRTRRRLNDLVGLQRLQRGEDDHWASQLDHDIDKAMGQIPNRQEVGLRLRYCVGLSVGEVAASLGISYAATESLLARGRRAFRVAHLGNGQSSVREAHSTVSIALDGV